VGGCGGRGAPPAGAAAVGQQHDVPRRERLTNLRAARLSCTAEAPARWRKGSVPCGATCAPGASPLDPLRCFMFWQA
jgi:hypothetical protein